MMKYYNNNGEIFAYDEATQQELIDAAITAGWVETSKPTEPEPAPITIMSSLAFFDRFTESEQDAVVGSNILDVKKIYGRMMGADFIDTTDLETITGLDGLIAYGLVSADRKAEILATA